MKPITRLGAAAAPFVTALCVAAAAGCSVLPDAATGQRTMTVEFAKARSFYP